MVDIPESLPGVPDVSCVSCRDMPLPSPSVSGSDAPPSRPMPLHQVVLLHYVPLPLLLH
jgi:hypothetical protein